MIYLCCCSYHRPLGDTNFTVKDIAKTESSMILDGAHPCRKYEVAVGVKYMSSSDDKQVKVDAAYKKRYWLFSSKTIQVKENLTPKPPSRPKPVAGSPHIMWSEDSGQCYPKVVSRSVSIWCIVSTILLSFLCEFSVIIV